MSQAIMEMVRQHRECDEYLTRCEAALHEADLARAAANFKLFSDELDQHFALEEERLFPAFENATGMRSGPTVVMRGEHAEIRGLRDEAASALGAADVAGALGAVDTLNVLIQQHNVKEENILYPMCGGSVPDLAGVLGMAAPAAAAPRGGCGGGGGGCGCGS